MKILVIIYMIIMTTLAVPTVMVMFEDVKTELKLDASGSDEQWEFLKDISQLIDFANDIGYKLTAGEMTRTMYQQRYNVAHGLSWTYNSNHLKRRAFDVNLFIDGKYRTDKEAYRELGEFWESLNSRNRWGGRFNDAPHFERR